MKKTFIHRLTFAQAIMVLPLAALCQGGNDTTDVYFNPDKGLAREHYEKMSRRKTTYDINMEGYVGSAGENTIWGFSANPQANIPVGKKADITAGVGVGDWEAEGAADLRKFSWRHSLVVYSHGRCDPADF